MSDLTLPLVATAVVSAVVTAIQSRKKTKMMKKGPLAQPKEIPPYFQKNKYPAKAHNKRVKDAFVALAGKAVSDMAFLIPGEEMEERKYCDTVKPFRQERYFYYLSGVNIPGSMVLYDLAEEKLTLFLPNIDWDDVMWSGLPLSLKEAAEKFDVDEVKYIDELFEVLGSSAFSSKKFYTTDMDHFVKYEKDSDKKAILAKIIPGDKDFFESMDETRLIKDEYEIETLRHVAKISDHAHYAVMSALPIELNEIQIEAEFAYHSTRQGARSLGYDPICCSGPACGTLHYIENTDDLAGKHSVLIDAGAEWNNYTTDVTRCFPINGKWTKEHRAIYETVLEMQSETMKLMKPGANWDDLHILAHKILIRRLREFGIFKKEFTEQEIFDAKVSCAFYPHGLGHMMGLDVHDVAGKANYEDPDPYFQYLRIRRPLQAGMVVTNEPGCYFNKFLIKELLEKHPERAKMVDFEVMKTYMYIGGVRIEDDILITKDGYEDLTGITSDPDEIEKIITEGLKKTRDDFHVIV